MANWSLREQRLFKSKDLIFANVVVKRYLLASMQNITRKGNISMFIADRLRMKFRKFKNRPITVDGIRFDSQKEATRYLVLSMAQSKGFVKDLKVHPKWDLVVNGIKIGTYTADFSYIDPETGKLVVEDVKGYKTRDYKRVKKLMKAIHGIDIVEK